MPQPALSKMPGTQASRMDAGTRERTPARTILPRGVHAPRDAQPAGDPVPGESLQDAVFVGVGDIESLFCRKRAEGRDDMHPSYLGTKPRPSPAPALYRAGWWRGQERTLERCPGGWQVPVSRERVKPGVPSKICLEAACREHRPPFPYPGTFRERLGGVCQTPFREHVWRNRVPGTIHPQGCHQ